MAKETVYARVRDAATKALEELKQKGVVKASASELLAYAKKNPQTGQRSCF